jgi:primosomal protein N' (replication factor Y)
LPGSADVLGPLVLAAEPGPVLAGRGQPASEQSVTAGADDGVSAGDRHVADPKGADEEPQDTVRVLLRVPKTDALALASALRLAQAGRSARKDPGAVRVQIDPAELI